MRYRFGALVVSALVVFAAILMPGQCLAAQEFSGADRYETAALEAQAAYSSGADVVIVADGENGWSDALSSAGLAGALKGPILFATRDSVPGVTANALANLHPQRVIVVGGTARVSDGTAAALGRAAGGAQVDRVAGADRYATQVAIYQYGASGYDGTSHWNTSLVLVASGDRFPDALSLSPLAAAQASPIFLARADGNLSTDQINTIRQLAPATTVAAGGPVVISDATVSTLGAVRLAGATRYETNREVANWCVSQGYLTWSSPAFATGEKPFDALAGGPLQGVCDSPLLLATGSQSPSVTLCIGARPADWSYFGGPNAISTALRRYIEDSIAAGGPLAMGYGTLSDGSQYFANKDGLYTQQEIETGKVGWQNPSQYYQVSSKSATLPAEAYSTPFHYVTPSRIAIDASRQDCVEAMIARAYDYIGTPYKWAWSREPGAGVDCSGLVIQCLYATGMSTRYTSYGHMYDESIPRVTTAMRQDNRFLHVSLAQRQRGDLIFYPGHVAIYLGGDQIIEAYPPRVMVSNMWSRGTIVAVLRPFV